jgi:hypothetical protein
MNTRFWCKNSVLFYYVWNVHRNVSYYFISLYSDHCTVSNSSLVIPILTFAPNTAEVLKIVLWLSNSRQNSLEGGPDHCNASVTIGQQEQEWQFVPKCVPTALDWALILGCMTICWRRWNPKIANLHAWNSTVRKSFLSFLILPKNITKNVSNRSCTHSWSLHAIFHCFVLRTVLGNSWYVAVWPSKVWVI